MDNVKNDDYYIAAIISDLKLIRKNTENVSKAELEKNTVLCDSVLFRIIQVSENTSRLSDQFKAIPHNSMHGSRRPFPRLFWRRNLEKPPVFLRFLSQNRRQNYSAIRTRELCGIALK